MKIEGLETLVKLDDLYLSNNGIQQVEGLEHNVSNSLKSYYLKGKGNIGKELSEMKVFDKPSILVKNLIKI